jgi:alkylhydroperoxidase family enzyme
VSPSVPLVSVEGTALQRLRALGVEVSDLYRALGNNPPLLGAWIELAWGLREHAGTPRSMRELMILRSAQIHGAGYQWDDHLRMAFDAGVTEAQVEALDSWRASPFFDPATRAALALMEQMIEGMVGEETLKELAAHFDPTERVELIVTAGFYCMVPRVLDALRLNDSDG